jgi:hypothetical protein
MFFIRLVKDGGLCGHPSTGSAVLAWHTEAEAETYLRENFDADRYVVVEFVEKVGVVN